MLAKLIRKDLRFLLGHNSRSSKQGHFNAVSKRLRQHPKVLGHELHGYDTKVSLRSKERSFRVLIDILVLEDGAEDFVRGPVCTRRDDSWQAGGFE